MEPVDYASTSNGPVSARSVEAGRYASITERAGGARCAKSKSKSPKSKRRRSDLCRDRF